MQSPRFVSPDAISLAIQQAIAQIYCQPDPLVIDAIRQAINIEKEPIARDILKDIVRNSEIAQVEHHPTCQDTGTLVVFIECGSAVHLGGADLRATIETAASCAWHDLCLRDSIVSEPILDRSIVTSPLPVVIHADIVPGSKFLVTLALKGGGAENMSALTMFSPTTSLSAIQEYIADVVVNAGGRSCPPVIVGVGIGGNFETCALLAKKALFRELGSSHSETAYADMERDIQDDINARGCGPMGMGGSTTALAVHIITAPCHIASLPVAVNLQCHAHRHTSFEL